ncbi:Uncharacterised protein [Mycobacterium tuberculosis]|nr:Uncharacterised protein [Mycobacterium tuberculosis]
MSCASVDVSVARWTSCRRGASFAAGCVVDSFEPLVVAAGDAEGFADGSVGFVGIAL